VTDLLRAPAVFLTSAERVHREPRPSRAWFLMIVSATVVSIASILMILVGALTMFRARALYRWMARAVSRGVLALYVIRIQVHRPHPLPACQTVFVSNHTSTLDLFVLVALGLPNSRFFLSGFLRKLVPLGIISWLLGTFFTVPQNRPEERVRIFERAERVLRRTGESVYLSPEGGRITTGEIGPFNKGAFHLATNLQAPIVPFYIRIPAQVDPRTGFDARPGIVDVFFLPAIDTRGWTVADLVQNTSHVRRVLTRAHQELSCAP
jgi:putative phosphoserine phosphatase/1-acylglycerol-3-phosphate O-acyltransferase